MADLSKFHVSNGTIIATHAGSVVESSGDWPAGSHDRIVSAALNVLEAAGSLLTPKHGLKRITASFPGSTEAYTITLDKERVYITRSIDGSGLPSAPR